MKNEEIIWTPESELWPIPGSIPADVASTFPGLEAVELLLATTRRNFETEEAARMSAIGFVNYRRRLMAREFVAELPA